MHSENKRLIRRDKIAYEAALRTAYSSAQTVGERLVLEDNAAKGRNHNQKIEVGATFDDFVRLLIAHQEDPTGTGSQSPQATNDNQ